jgi:hypothetical protein
LRPTGVPASTEAEDVVLHDDSIAVSVVFEPDMDPDRTPRVRPR